jgi:hypothetical protein
MAALPGNSAVEVEMIVEVEWAWITKEHWSPIARDKHRVLGIFRGLPGGGGLPAATATANSWRARPIRREKS